MSLPNFICRSNGSFQEDFRSRLSIKNISASYTITQDDTVILASMPVANIVITLPDAWDVPEQYFIIKKIDDTIYGITVNGTIDDGSVIKVIAPYQYVIVISDGSQYYTIGGNV